MTDSPEWVRERVAGADVHLTDTGYRVEWYLIHPRGQAPQEPVEFDTLADAYDWLEGAGFTQRQP